jgi:bleomycin hydrolase
MKNKFLVLLATLFFTSFSMQIIHAQDESEEGKGYEFTMVKEIPATSVKNQYRSGTCWSFSSLAFIESELLRMGKGEYDLSEMFVVRHTYEEKAQKYVRFHGEINFSGGGAFHDALHVLKEYGMVPEEVYNGRVIGEDNHIHGELDAVTAAYVETILKNKNKKLSPVWFKGFQGIMDAYLGEVPETFSSNEKEYTPQSFAAELGLNVEDYIEIGSYTHHPFYTEFILEVPDNWMLDQIHNIPMDEMMDIIDNAIENGYTVGWGSDVSEKGFSWKNGVAIVPDEDLDDLSGTEKEKWEKLTDKEKKNALYSFVEPVKEKTITQAMRQEEFDNYSTTDDHGMQITGIAEDQDGNQFYKLKNSWGTDGHIYDGYFFASKAFVQLKTIDIVVHKDAIPKNILKKMGL